MKGLFAKKLFYLFISNHLFFTAHNSSYCNHQDKVVNNYSHHNNIIKNPTNELAIDCFIAAANDLDYYAQATIDQFKRFQTKNTSITIQVNEKGKHKKTERYTIKDGNTISLIDSNKQKLDSGDPQTLIDFALYCIKNFPAKKRIFIFSNHGSGITDTNNFRLINPGEFFALNPSTITTELERKVDLIDFINKCNSVRNCNITRGICFDENFQSYLTNQKLEYALKTICNEAANYLKINKFKYDIILMDACLMQMVEIGNILKNYANIFIASEEVELGPGLYYDETFNSYNKEITDSLELAKHIVKLYEKTYYDKTDDYTLSAVDLNNLDSLENNINTVSEILIYMLENQLENSVKSTLKKAKTHIGFEDPSFIDLASLYKNLIENIDNIKLKPETNQSKTDELCNKLKEGLSVIEKIIIEKVSGKNIKYAKGISIYYPEKRIHNTYRQTNFAQSNKWLNFLTYYTSL